VPFVGPEAPAGTGAAGVGAADAVDCFAAGGAAALPALFLLALSFAASAGALLPRDPVVDARFISDFFAAEALLEDAELPVEVLAGGLNATFKLEALHKVILLPRTA